MSRTEKLRRWARRLRVEEGRLRKIAADMIEGDFKFNGAEVGKHATRIGCLSIALDCLATHVRDKRGAQQRNENG